MSTVLCCLVLSSQVAHWLDSASKRKRRSAETSASYNDDRARIGDENTERGVQAQL